MYSYEDRKKILESNRNVDHVCMEESLEKKRGYILKYGADILVMGDDWKGQFDEFGDICEVKYLPRSEGISTTRIIAGLK